MFKINPFLLHLPNINYHTQNIMEKIGYILKTALLAATAVFMATCGGSDVNYRNAVPDNTLFLVSVNPNSIYKKAEIGDIKDNQLYRKFFEELEDDALAQLQINFIKSIIEKPENTGINTENDFYVFVALEPESTPDDPELSYGLLCEIADKKKFDQIVDFVVEASQGEMEKREKSGTNILVLQEHSMSTYICAYNNISALILKIDDDYEEAAEAAARMLNQKKQDSFFADKNVASYFDRKDDISFVLAMDNCYDIIMQNNLMSSTMFAKKLAMSKLTFNFNFEKGKISSDAKFLFKDKAAEKEFQNSDFTAGNQKGDIIKYISDNSVMALGATMNGSKLYEFLTTNMKQFAMVGLVPQVKQVMDAIYGDFVFSLSAGDGDTPGLTIIVTMKDTKVVDSMLEEMGGFLNEIGDNQYSVNMGRGNMLTLGIKDKHLYFTNDDNTVSAINGNKIASLDNKLFKGNKSTAIVNFDQLSDIITTNAGRSHKTLTITKFLSIFDNIEVYCPDNTSGHMDVNMADKNQNAAKTIYGAAMQLAEDNL